MKLIIAIILSFCFLQSAFAYIPPVHMILSRTAENAGNANIQIEQDLTFNNGAESLTLHETWIVQGSQSYKVTVTSAKDPQFKIQIQYSAGQRAIILGGKKLTGAFNPDFFERYMFSRSAEHLSAIFGNVGFLPQETLEKSNVIQKNQTVWEHKPEPFVRLSRIDGQVAYHIGPKPEADKPTIGAWIIQDQFILRKLILPSGAKLTLDKYQKQEKQPLVAMSKQLTWDDRIVPITVTKAEYKKDIGGQFAPSLLEQSTDFNALKSVLDHSLVEEFYTRFR